MATFTRYRILAVRRQPNNVVLGGGPVFSVLGEILAPEMSLLQHVKSPGEAKFSFLPSSLEPDIATALRNLRAQPLEARIYIDEISGSPVWAGPIIDYSVSRGVCTATAKELLYYLAYMGVDSDLAFTAADLHLIVKQLVDAWQNNLLSAHYGINTTSVATSGILRDKTYLASEQHNVLRRVQQLSEDQGGFDVWVNPTDRQLTLAAARGTDRTASVFIDRRNIAADGISVSVAAGTVGSVAYGQATGPNITEGPLIDKAINPTTRNTFGRAAVFGSWSDVDNPSELASRNLALLASVAEQELRPNPNLVPVVDADVDDFHVGDTVRYAFDSGFGLHTGDYRITTKQVTSSLPRGETTIDVAFA